MLSLSKTLQDRSRSFLSFAELHRSRAVCKEWVDVEKVPKVLTTEEKSPPLWASFSQVSRFEIACNNMEAKTLLHVVLGRNQNHLKCLRINGFLSQTSNLYFPRLDALEEFYSSSQKSPTYALIRKAPNIRRLSFWDIEYDIDVSLTPHLEELTMPSDGVKIENLDATKLTKLRFRKVYDVENVLQYFTIPNLEIKCEFCYDEDCFAFDLVSTKDALAITWVDPDTSEDPPCWVTMFAETVRKIRAIRDTPFQIADGIMNQEKETRIMQIAMFLTHTKMFDFQELLKMCERASCDNEDFQFF